MLKINKKLRDYQIYFYIILFICSFITLSLKYWMLVLKLNNTADKLIFDFFGYWNTQTIILIGFYSGLNFGYYFTRQSALKWVTNFHFRNFINVSLIITLLLYYFNLMIPNFKMKEFIHYNYLEYWIANLIQYFVIPIIMLFYSVLYPNKIINWKIFFKKNILLYLIYPQIYIIIVLIRGYCLLKLNPNLSWEDAYPYFYLNINQKDGVLIFIASLIIIFTTLILLASLLIFINNIIYNKYKKKET